MSPAFQPKHLVVSMLIPFSGNVNLSETGSRFEVYIRKRGFCKVIKIRAEIKSSAPFTLEVQVQESYIAASVILVNSSAATFSSGINSGGLTATKLSASSSHVITHAPQPRHL